MSASSSSSSSSSATAEAGASSAAPVPVPGTAPAPAKAESAEKEKVLVEPELEKLRGLYTHSAGNIGRVCVERVKVELENFVETDDVNKLKAKDCRFDGYTHKYDYLAGFHWDEQNCWQSNDDDVLEAL